MNDRAHFCVYNLHLFVRTDTQVLVSAHEKQNKKNKKNFNLKADMEKYSKYVKQQKIKQKLYNEES